MFKRLLGIAMLTALVVVAFATSALAVGVMPNVANVPTGWTTDRYDPAAFVNVGPYNGRPAALGIAIDSTTDLANRSPGFQSTFYNTQGRQFAFSPAAGPGSVVSSDLFIPTSWNNPVNGSVRSDMWVVMQDISPAITGWAIIGFTNYGGSPRLRVWDGDVGWVDLGTAINYNAWNRFSVELMPDTSVKFYVNGSLVFTDFATGSTASFSAVIMQAYNFADPVAAPGAVLTPYTAHWANSTMVVDNDGQGSASDCDATDGAFATVQLAVSASGPGDTIRVCSGTYVQTATSNLSSADVTVTGVGPTKPVIQAASAIGNAFFVGASGVTLNNLEIQKTDLPNQDLIAVQGNNFTATNNLIYGPDPGTTWSVNGIVSRGFLVSNNPGFNISNNVIQHLRQPAYVSGSLNVAQGTISGNQVSGTRGWVIEGGNVTFTGNTWGPPENQGCDIAILNQPGINPTFYQPLTTLSSSNSNAYVCAQFPGGENGRTTAYVDSTPSLGSGSSSNNYTTIQEGINGVLTGGTVQVAAGGYSEDLFVTKTLRLTGAGQSTTTITGPIGGAGGNTIQVQANNVEIDGFTITRAGNNVTDWNNPGLNSAGIQVQGLGFTGLNFHDNRITGMRSGVDLNNTGGHSIHNNVITDNHTGMILRNQTDSISLTQNVITNNRTVGILFLDGSGGTNSPVQTCASCSITNNNISGNWYGEIVDRQTGGALPAPGGSLKNFSGNWFGTNAPVVTTANSSEPGYAGHIPVAYGGSATDPGGQPDIAGPASANLDFSPFLNSGTDTSGTYGFQGSFTALNVSATSSQAAPGNPNNIQEAIDLVSTGGTLNIEAGTYAGNVNVNKALDIKGNFTVNGIFNVSATGASVSPGLSPGIINTGNLTLGAGTTTNMEINGLTVGTQYDQLNVTGTVSINPTASLNPTLGFIPTAGNSFTIINNDGADAVSGTFYGLPEGTVFYVLTTAFKISYVGGTGNDVVLSVVNPCNAVSIENEVELVSPTTVDVDITTDSTTGNGLKSTQFVVTFNPAVVTFDSISLGTVTAGRSIDVNSSIPGVLNVSIYGASDFVGAGTLAVVTFNKVGLPGTSTPVSFSSFMFNEGTACISTTPGSVTITGGTITGSVRYSEHGGSPLARPIPNVTVSGAGAPPVSALTDAFGAYSLSGFGSGSYTRSASKVGQDNGAVGGFDAAAISQHVVNLVPITDARKLFVADVSGNGTVTSFDAALIARFAVALPGAGSSGTWVVKRTGVNPLTDLSTYGPSTVYADITGESYTAYLMGDVTGNWNLPTNQLGGRPAGFEGQKPLLISAPELVVPANTEVVLPITIRDTTGQGINSYQFDLRYNPDVLEPSANFADLSGSISDGYLATVNPIEPGLIKVVVFGPNPLAGNGRLLNLKFNVIGEVDSESTLTWETFGINEGGINFEVMNGRVAVRAASNDAAIAGRVLSAAGQPVGGATVTLVDTNGQTRTARTSSLGNFRFAELTVGQTYTVSASAKRYTFASQTVSVTGDAVTLDLISEQ